MSRIANSFDELRSRGEAALIPYLTVGYPSLEGTRELLYSIVEAGADLVELGIPFSDPLADGATLQRINNLALERGATLRGALALVASVRERIGVPLILMSYYNPLLRLGLRAFAEEAQAAGVDGVIVPDLPQEESRPLRASCQSGGLDLIGMVAPSSPEARVAAIGASSSGFIYCVSLTGVTGARNAVAAGVDALVARVKRASALPAVVGFGISSPEQVRAVSAFSDGVVVASALMDRIDKQPGGAPEEASRFVKELKSACRGAN